MSVTGFRIDGSIQKYDYNALDNKPDDGLTEATKSALLQLARKVAYIDEHGEDYYQNLYDSFYSNFVKVTAILTGCYSSNMSTAVKEGTAYSATIYANPGYSLAGANVSITMGGLNVTGAYSNGAINIPNVTGDLVITVTAISTVSSISAVYTQSGTVYDEDTLDSLKDDLVVTAAYSDSSTGTVAADAYTLSGELTKGTSTITVSYGGKTTTFDVTVEYGFLANVGFFNGSSVSAYNKKLALGGSDVNRAMAFCTKSYNGIQAFETPYRREQLVAMGWVDPRYALPIPSGISKISVQLQGDLICAIQAWKYQNDEVSNVSPGSWSEAGGVTDYDLSTFIADGATILTIIFKNLSETSLESYEIDSTTVHISVS